LVAELAQGRLQDQHLFFNAQLAAEYISSAGNLWQGNGFPIFSGFSPSVYFDEVIQWVVQESQSEYDGIEFIVKQVSLTAHRPDGSAAEVES
jgi:hypothetical protein